MSGYSGRPAPSAGSGTEPDTAPPRVRRPFVERLGLGAIAAVVVVLFGGMGAASFLAGEWFLGAMGLLGALMTGWVGLLSLLRG